MITITIGNNQVSIDSNLFHSFNDKNNMALMLSELIDKCLYSGESLILVIDRQSHMETVQEWVNPHVSSRYKKMK